MKNKKHLLLSAVTLIILLAGKISYGQELAANENIETKVVITDNRIHELNNRYNRSHELHGYRIQIISSSKKEKAKKAKSIFASSYGHYEAHEKYQQPFFIIKVGDFLSKLEAEKFHRQIRDEFPGSFLLPDIIDPIDQYSKTN